MEYKALHWLLCMLFLKVGHLALLLVSPFNDDFIPIIFLFLPLILVLKFPGQPSTSLAPFLHLWPNNAINILFLLRCIQHSEIDLEQFKFQHVEP